MTDNDINVNKQNLDDVDALIGKIIADRYEILSLLGTGGIGIVYKAKHTLMDRIVAIKLLRKDLLNDERNIQRFQQEAKAVSMLNHPNIVSVFDFGITNNQEAYLVMDFLKGKDLDTYIQEQGIGKLDTMLPFFIQIGEAIAHAHKHGIIHRDLKPGNIIICENNQQEKIIKLVDFGMAKLQTQIGQQALSLTKPGEVFGSPFYMSPEQCNGKKLDARSDIYAMGCVMYEALSGRPPFVADNMVKMAELHLKAKAEPISSVTNIPDFSPEMQSIINRCLEKNPDHRYQSANELLAQLKLFYLSQKTAGLQLSASNKIEIDNLLASSSNNQANNTKNPWSQKSIFLASLTLSLLIIIAAVQIVMSNRTAQLMKETTPEILSEQASNLAHAGKADEAESTYLAAIKAANDQNSEELVVLKCLTGLADLYCKEGKLDLAKTVLDQTSDHITNLKTNESAELAPILLRLGKLYILTGNFSEAEVIHKKALEIVENSFGENNQKTAEALNQYALLKRKQGQKEEALNLERRVKKIKKMAGPR